MLFFCYTTLTLDVKLDTSSPIEHPHLIKQFVNIYFTEIGRGEKEDKLSLLKIHHWSFTDPSVYLNLFSLLFSLLSPFQEQNNKYFFIMQNRP